MSRRAENGQMDDLGRREGGGAGNRIGDTKKVRKK